MLRKQCSEYVGVDPEFPYILGANPYRERLIINIFVKFSPKTHEIEGNWSMDSPVRTCGYLLCNNSHNKNAFQ